MRTSRAHTRCRERIDALTQSAMGSDALRLEAVSAIRAAVGFDMWAWPVADPDSQLYAGALSDMDPSLVGSLPRYFLLQESGVDFNPRALSANSPAATAVFSELTAGDLARSAGWDECLRPHGIGDVMVAAGREASGCWGWLVFHRLGGERPFNLQEAELLTELASSLGALARRASCVAPYTMTAPAHPPPGVLIIDEELRSAGWTPAAHEWLDRLTPIQRLVLYGIAGRALRSTSHESHASVRIRTSDGTWATLDGALLDGNEERQVAITLRASSSDEVLGILTRGYGLTPRESDVARHLVNGLTTDQAAQRLQIAPLTLKHHLKAIFRKASVRTRGELVSALTGRPSPD